MKIFISSTYEDLKDHRQVVRDVILRLGHHPVGMEDFGARPEEWNKAALKAMDDGSGALVGIYAHRYGSIPPGDSLSITEQEFDKARTLGWPCYCYCMDPAYTVLDAFKETGDQAQRLAHFMGKVNRLLRSTFTDPNDLAKKVAADLGRDLPRSPTRIHALPAPPADFIGRTDETSNLLEQLGRGSGIAISGLAGMGGVGKTALALVVANQLIDQYPDAQLYLKLKGISQTPLSPSEVMLQVIRAFEPLVDLRQSTEEEITATYRTLLSGKRALLLLDDAADAAQVKPLLPPASCAVLVTSRHFFTLPGLTPLRLDVLSKQDAHDLLIRICRRIAEQAVGIAEACDCLALALRIAGSTLAEHPDLSPQEYLYKLADRRERINVLKSENDPELNLRAAFDYSYALLPYELQVQWRVLSVFPATFDAPAAAAVWAIEEDAARTTLSHLVRVNLVAYDAPTQRYGLHDLLAGYADGCLNDEERAPAQARHSEHYVQVAAAADALYVAGGENSLAGLKLFDAEWRHIRAGQAWSIANMGSSARALELCSKYPDLAPHILNLRLPPRNLLRWLEPALGAAHKLGDRRAEGYHLGNLGMAHRQMDEVPESIPYYEQALAIACEIGNRHGEAAALRGLGLAYAELAELSKAVSFHEQALAIDREIGYRRGEGQDLCNLGAVYHKLSDFHKAIAHYEQALAIAREIDDRRNEGNHLGKLGVAYASLGETRKAIDYHAQALEIDREIGDRRGEGRELYNLSIAHEKSRDLRQAVEFAEASLATRERIEDPKAEQTRRWLKTLRDRDVGL